MIEGSNNLVFQGIENANINVGNQQGNSEWLIFCIFLAFAVGILVGIFLLVKKETSPEPPQEYKIPQIDVNLNLSINLG